MMNFTDLAEELIHHFNRPIDGPWDNDIFSSLALRVFEYQYSSNPTYANYAKKRGATPSRLQDWKKIPPVPTLAFKEFPIVSGELALVEAVFKTSGTSSSELGRGEHHILDLSLYRASLIGSMRYQFYSRQSPALLALVKDPAQSQSSSLSFMLGETLDNLSMGKGGFYVNEDNQLQNEKLVNDIRKFESSGYPVLLAGTAFAFVRWMDWLEESGICFELPANSRIMETGGFKGQSREVSRVELYELLGRLHGIPISSIISEYGMTEMLSQLYERTSVIHETGEIEHLGYEPPPWVRSLVLDVNTLSELPVGEEGVLCHFDLANVGSAMAVLTEDVGVTLDNGTIRLNGRLKEAEQRGCSLAMDDFPEI